MMRSLWAGVTGLQAHQIAIDVEGNNIANVNTTGFKYSRANFSDLLSQTAKIATAPQGELGGKNSMQIGLGTQISSVTKIFKQGSVQTIDKNTDLAIQGDGFFVISPDGGKTYKYTRNGDFAFDAKGNFVDANGYIAQGWVRDKDTNVIDSTAPIANITIPPGLTTPANATKYITVKANLDSGDSVGSNKSVPIYQLDQYSNWYDKNGDGVRDTGEMHVENDSFDNEFNADKKLVERGLDMGVLFNANGDAFNLRSGQGVWMSYAEAKYTTGAITTPGNLNISINGETISGTANNVGEVISLVNAKTNLTGVQAQLNGTNSITFINTNKTGTEANMKNINLVVNGANAVGGLTNTVVNTAYQYTYSPSYVNTPPTYDSTATRQFTTTEDLRKAMQTDARSYVNYTGNVITNTAAWTGAAAYANRNDSVEVTVNKEGQFQISNPSGDALNEDDGDILANTTLTAATNLGAGIVIPAGALINNTGAPITILDANNNSGGDIIIPAGGTLGAAFTTANAGTLPAGLTFTQNINVDTTDNKQDNLYLSVTGLTNATNGVSENLKFSASMGAIQGALGTGNAIRTSQSIKAAAHASSIDVFDSLGSKHTVRFEFLKTGFTDSGGTEWSVLINVPEPGKINYSGAGPDNIITGSISFNSDGSLATFTPTNLTYTANNGSTPNQNVELRFGTASQFDGMTSFDKDSGTSGISQDGFPGGDLSGIRVDETGTLIGSFTNGRSFGLAQVAMAKFTNNEGLESDGGNTFIQTSNSGDPVIGSAATGGKGFVQASSLEMSNVDLSRSLTQLIVIQRGYQANSKTITTSDEMLNTLLQLK